MQSHGPRVLVHFSKPSVSLCDALLTKGLCGLSELWLYPHTSAYQNIAYGMELPQQLYATFVYWQK